MLEVLSETDQEFDFVHLELYPDYTGHLRYIDFTEPEIEDDCIGESKVVFKFDTGRELHQKAIELCRQRGLDMNEFSEQTGDSTAND